MPELKGRARTYLRGLAHGLRPVVQVGKEGLTDAVVRSIDQALLGSELIKVQIAADRDERRALAATAAAATGAECVGLIGRIAILYRTHPDPERRRLILPG